MQIFYSTLESMVFLLGIGNYPLESNVDFCRVKECCLSQYNADIHLVFLATAIHRHPAFFAKRRSTGYYFFAISNSAKPPETIVLFIE